MGKKVDESFQALPVEDRIRRCRQFAEEAFLRAGKATNRDLRAGFLTMATGWHSLASELEQDLRASQRPSPSQVVEAPVAKPD
jgi:hypothetical protein